MTQLESQGYASYYDRFVDQNCQQLSATECRAQYNDGLLKSVRIILDEIPIVGEGMAGYECWSSPGAFICGGIFAGIIPLGKRGLDVVEEGAEQLQKKLPETESGIGSTKTYQTYIKTHNKTGIPYCGRASGCGTPDENVAKRDRNHHKNKDDYGPAVLDRSSTNYDAIRGREQQLIDAHGGADRKAELPATRF